MIDIHSHILPGIDDGSRSIEETIEMIKEAYQAGFTSIVSTSHYMEGSYEADSIQRQDMLNKIQLLLQDNNIPVTLYQGTEAYISVDLVEQIQRRQISTLNQSRYLLFELPMNVKPLFLEELIYNLLSYEIVPIIAHPERYSFVQENPNVVFDFIDRGVLFQANFGSIAGMYGNHAKKTVTKLLKNNMIHFLGSDVHKPNHIYANMEPLVKEIKKVIGDSQFKVLTQINPEYAIQNREIQIPTPTKIRKFFT